MNARVDLDLARNPGFELALKAIVLLALFGVAAILMSVPFGQIALKIPLNYNEGYNAYHTAAVLAGTPLYPDLDALVTNNYPPLSYYAIALVTLVVDDPLVAGRVLSALSLLVTAVNLGIVTRALTRNGYVALAAPLVLLIYAGMWFNNYTAMNDPQWFGHALQMGGLAVLVTGSTLVPGAGRLVVATLLLFAGGLVKHNLVVMPLAVAIWLAIHDRRALLVFCLTGAAATVASLLAGWLAYGPSVFRSVLLHARVFDPGLMKRMIGELAEAFAPFGIAVAVLAVLRWRDPGTRLILLVYAVGLLVGVPALGGEGVNFNALFDVVLATAVSLMMLSVVMGEHLAMAGYAPGTALALMTALLCAPLLAGTTTANGAHNHWRWVGAREAHYVDLIDSLARTDGPVACHMLSMCFWAGKPLELEFFNYGQKLKTGRVTPDLLMERIRTRYYGRLQLQDDFFDKNLVPEALEQAILENYTIERRFPSLVLVPKT
ncbi:hypothetical protein [Chthonobacter rhizosphaerae]|uniref:hypothetical protein n=1 Tax=Chthonobacter rhizosphaerae TaxID=2735553 RepID=UPI0015EEB966|nr:hypothetical protein [Chthonobacter rhizosphaerae]